VKVSIGTNIKEGPWGGGNLFAINLTNYLKKQGHEVVNNLKDEDIDIILLTEPRKTSESSAFTHIDVWYYKTLINKEALVVHRLNECDERKNTKFVNKYLLEANKVADQTIFVSEWLRNLFINHGDISERNEVILAGADSNIFNRDGYKAWDRKEKLRIVTHHWGANWYKGFDIYKEIDNLLSKNYWKNKIEFTYIGNYPKDINFDNTKIVNPLSGKKLANKIKENHVYITASRNEPSGNHHIEGAQCGLPILFINSGGIPEYCTDYGVEFNEENFQEKLEEIVDNYNTYEKNMENYPFSSNQMCREYLDLFKLLLSQKNEIIKSRKHSFEINRYQKYIYYLKRKNLLGAMRSSV
tara:strand:+ start:1259 stop:2323 length:1065 start_codon:yes stop_codon:yes gene_type:complete